jgi:type IV pilus assembly protein PilF
MTMAMAAQGRFRAAWLAAAATASVLGAMLAGCATAPQQQDSISQMVTPSEESDVRHRARIRLELASGYYGEGKTNIALDELKKVIDIDPTFAEAYNLRGLIYMRLNDNREAEASFRKALSLDARDANALHNYGWLQCQLGRYPEADKNFQQALANPLYGGRSKTLMAMGLCEARAGHTEQAEKTLARSYELDAGNPITGYNLAQLLYTKGDYKRAQFYIRRLNNSELANAESLWLGIRVEQHMNDPAAMGQLSEQLRKRFPDSRERQALDRGAFNE